jgi:hypothetical protein
LFALDRHGDRNTICSVVPKIMRTTVKRHSESD